MLEKEIIAVIHSLNELLPEGSTEAPVDLEAKLRTIISNAFNDLAPSQRKNLYYALSKKFHADRRGSDVYLQVLSELNLSSLPQQLLVDVWSEIKPVVVAEPEPEPVRSYNPFAYTTDVKAKLTEILIEMATAMQAKPEITPEENPNEKMFKIMAAGLRARFPELYQYEQYSNNMQWTAYIFASVVNLMLVASFIPKNIMDGLSQTIHGWEVDLLSYATDGRYAKTAVETVVMRPTVAAMNLFQVDDLSDEEIKDIYEAYMLQTEKSQRDLLEKMGQENAQELQDVEFSVMFQKVYLAVHFVVYSQHFPKIFENAVVQQNKEKLASIDQTTIQSILASFIAQDITDEMVAEMYQVFRKTQSDQIEAGMSQLRRLYRGFQHINFLSSALYETWNANVPMNRRLIQALTVLTVLPLIAINLSWDLFSELFNDALILIKMASVALINTPLYVSNRFFAPVPPPVHSPVLMIKDAPVEDVDLECRSGMAV